MGICRRGGEEVHQHFPEYFHDLLDLDMLQLCPPCCRKGPEVGGIGVRGDAGMRKGIICRKPGNYLFCNPFGVVLAEAAAEGTRLVVVRAGEIRMW